MNILNIYSIVADKIIFRISYKETVFFKFSSKFPGMIHRNLLKKWKDKFSVREFKMTVSG